MARVSAAKTSPRTRETVDSARTRSPHRASPPARPSATLQRRGAERVSAILAAAEELLTESGYKAANLKAISERSGIPLASVYHYFADRNQVDVEILRSHLAQLEGVVDDALARLDSDVTLEDALKSVMDLTVQSFRDHPSLVELWFFARSESVTKIVDEYDDAISAALWDILLDRGLVAPDTPSLVMRLATDATNRLFDAAFRASPPTGDDKILAEAHRMITAYLRTYST